MVRLRVPVVGRRDQRDDQFGEDQRDERDRDDALRFRRRSGEPRSGQRAVPPVPEVGGHDRQPERHRPGHDERRYGQRPYGRQRLDQRGGSGTEHQGGPYQRQSQRTEDRPGRAQRVREQGGGQCRNQAEGDEHPDSKYGPAT